jgi:hypothetical protein
MMFQYQFKEFSDIIKFYVLHMIDFAEPDALEVLNTHMITFLVEVGYSADEIRLLNYALLKTKDDQLIVHAKNLATALWFADVYPEEVPDIVDTEMEIDGVTYKYYKGKLKIITNATKS